jgi:hypothetical protein
MFIAFFLLSFVNSGGFLVEAGQARDVAGADADRGKSMVICLAVRSGWCRRSWSPWAQAAL